MNPDSTSAETTTLPEGKRAHQRRERRRAILVAALPLFAQRPVDEVSMEEIARAAEVATGTLYTYFPNKEKLFEAATRRLFSSFHPQVMEILGDENRAPLERVRASLLAKHEHIERHRTFFESIHHLGLVPCLINHRQESPDPEQEASCADLIAEFMDATTACIAKAQTAGELRDDIPADILAQALSSLSRGLTEARHLRPPDGTSVEAHSALIFDLFLRGATPTVR